MASMYLPTWQLIKRRHTATPNTRTVLLASPKLHARIEKAVRKRKDLDLAYKIELEEQGLKAILHLEVVGQEMQFWLETVKTHYSMEEI